MRQRFGNRYNQVGLRDYEGCAGKMRRCQHYTPLEFAAREVSLENLFAAAFSAHYGVVQSGELLNAQALLFEWMVGAD